MGTKTKRRTRVAKLQAEIKKIQDRCEHSFELEKQLKLEKSSLQPGISMVDEHPQPATAVCTKCELKKEISIHQTCPHCFGAMSRPTFVNYKRCYTKTFLDNYPNIKYYSAALRTCQAGCGFRTVHLEWNQ